VPWRALAYVLGLAACSFHLAVGLWTFAMRWGVAVSKRARGRAGALAAVFGLVVFALGARTVVYLASGWRIGGEPAASEATPCPPGEPP
jgi:succinate dehydrogenase / fumarate reductase cytochrome b subunit